MTALASATRRAMPPTEFAQRRSAGEFPFGGLPVLDVETKVSHVCAAQSNSILRFAGRLSGLYPEDDLVKALKVDEALDVCEDINCLLGPSFHEQDPDKKMAMRKQLAEETLPEWAAYLERLLVNNGSNGFIVGDNLTIADLKLYWVVDFLTSGMLDGIPTSLLDKYAKVMTWRENISKLRESRLAEGAQN